MFYNIVSVTKKSKKERVAIYIDGSNFYNYLKDIDLIHPKGKPFSYSALVAFIAENREVVSMRFYIGIMRDYDNTERSREFVRKQQKFLAAIEKEGFIVKRGRIMYDKGRIREKGTDVKIAVDLIIGAVDDLYDTAIIVSSDTDLIPALKYLRHKEKKVEYVGFSHAPSLGMQRHANSSLLLREVDIKNKCAS